MNIRSAILFVGLLIIIAVLIATQGNFHTLLQSNADDISHIQSENDDNNNIADTANLESKFNDVMNEAFQIHQSSLDNLIQKLTELYKTSSILISPTTSRELSNTKWFDLGVKHYPLNDLTVQSEASRNNQHGLIMHHHHLPFTIPSMRTDIIKNEYYYEMQIDLPGFNKNDINVTIDNGEYLSIKAHRSNNLSEELDTLLSDTAKSQKRIHIERLSGYIERSFKLPADIQIDNSVVKYDNGILTITFNRIRTHNTESYSHNPRPDGSQILRVE